MVVIPVPGESSDRYEDFIDISQYLPYSVSKDKILRRGHVEQNMADAYFSDHSTAEASKLYGVSYKRLHAARQRGLKVLDRHFKIDDQFAYFLGWLLRLV